MALEMAGKHRSVEEQSLSHVRAREPIVSMMGNRKSEESHTLGRHERQHKRKEGTLKNGFVLLTKTEG